MEFENNMYHDDSHLGYYFYKIYHAYHEAEFLSPGICVPKEFNAGEGYTLPNLCAIHAVISVIFEFNAEDSLLFYDENKKHAVIILHSKRKESNNGV